MILDEDTSRLALRNLEAVACGKCSGVFVGGANEADDEVFYAVQELLASNRVLQKSSSELTSETSSARFSGGGFCHCLDCSIAIGIFEIYFTSRLIDEQEGDDVVTGSHLCLELGVKRERKVVLHSKLVSVLQNPYRFARSATDQSSSHSLHNDWLVALATLERSAASE